MLAETTALTVTQVAENVHAETPSLIPRFAKSEGLLSPKEYLTGIKDQYKLQLNDPDTEYEHKFNNNASKIQINSANPKTKDNP